MNATLTKPQQPLTREEALLARVLLLANKKSFKKYSLEQIAKGEGPKDELLIEAANVALAIKNHGEEIPPKEIFNRWMMRHK